MGIQPEKREQERNGQYSRKISGEKEAEQLGLRGIASMLQMGIQPEKWEQEEATWGNQSFWKLIQFLYFWVCLYTFCYTQG